MYDQVISLRLEDIGMDAGNLTVYRGCTPVLDAYYESDNNRSPTDVIPH